MTLKKRSWSWITAAWSRRNYPTLGDTKRMCTGLPVIYMGVLVNDVIHHGPWHPPWGTTVVFHLHSPELAWVLLFIHGLLFKYRLLIYFTGHKKKAAHLNEKVRLFQTYLGSNLMMWLQNHAKDHGKTDSSCPEKFPVGNFTSTHLRETYEKMR